MKKKEKSCLLINCDEELDEDEDENTQGVSKRDRQEILNAAKNIRLIQKKLAQIEHHNEDNNADDKDTDVDSNESV